MIRKIQFFLLALLVSACASAEQDPAQDVIYSRIIDVPGVGAMQYYAQNDPLWSDAFYEPFANDNFRRFGSGGCGPTAAAMAVTMHLSGDDLLLLNNSTRTKDLGFPYCVCSVNGHQCAYDHDRIVPATAEEFTERLPIIIGNYATGNNPRREKFRDHEPGTSYHLFESIANAYGLPYKRTRLWETASGLIESGWCAITAVTQGVFTNSSHYLIIIHIDEEWLYILDPLLRTDYNELDKDHILNVIEPGLVRVSLTHLNKLRFNTFYMIGPKDDIVDTPVDEHHYTPSEN